MSEEGVEKEGVGEGGALDKGGEAREQGAEKSASFRSQSVNGVAKGENIFWKIIPKDEKTFVFVCGIFAGGAVGGVTRYKIYKHKGKELKKTFFGGCPRSGESK